MRRRWLLFGGYLVLLLLSHLWRLQGPAPALPEGYRSVQVQAVDGEAAIDREVELAYVEWGRRDAAAPVLLLLHGSPGSSQDFRGLAPLLAAEFRLIAPDLPGFGHSTRKVPDYSIASYAQYTLQLLDRLGIDQVIAVGFSMSGGVALELYDIAPDRVAAIVLLSAIGAQEHELLGNYHLNHALHGLQLAVLRLMRHGVPHFGLFDDSMFRVEYGRNFYDTDQRPLRAVLERLEVPTLILHGDRDPLVPVSAALEHHRIVPQSELLRFDSDHFILFQQPERLAEPLREFAERVVTGRAVTRKASDPARRLAAEGPPQRVAAAHGVALLMWSALLALSTLVSEDLAGITAGLLVAQGRLGFIAASVACGIGIFFGDLSLYFIGRLGSSWLHRRPLSWIVSPSKIERTKAWFERRGGSAILLSRFLPGTRVPTYVTAGVLRFGVLWFVIRLLIPVILWTPLLVGMAWVLGESFFTTFASFSRYALPAFAVFLLLIWLLLSLVRSLSSHRGRRLLHGWWRRKRAWEFWPRWLFYPPVVLYVLYLGFKHRSLTLFTAANPGMPAGGFVGESKIDILERLDPSRIAPFRRLDHAASVEERRHQVEELLREHDASLPVVLKPDVGERGTGVVIARSEAEIDAYLAAMTRDAMAQLYVAGPEFGVFYVRLPGEERGRIFSLTEKLLPVVVGDGRSTVEELILADDRAVAMAKVYFEVQEARLDEVPASGESVRLVDLGTHCRGAIFLDGAAWITPELERVVEEISRSYDGFYFGRYDLRAPSLDALVAGRDLKVLELNGVTSEATHIYDPKNSLFDAYRVLFEQWRLAFEIGRSNRDRGAEPVGFVELIRKMPEWLKAVG